MFGDEENERLVHEAFFYVYNEPGSFVEAKALGVTRPSS